MSKVKRSTRAPERHCTEAISLGTLAELLERLARTGSKAVA